MYRLEGKDIVIDGFEQGIADTPYSGIADMRNIDIISFPKEAMVGFSEVSVTVPPAFNAVAYTAQDTGDTITVASTTGLYDRCAIVLNTNNAGGLSTGVVYYVGNITATTFKLYADISLGTPVVISSDGSGTLTTYQYGRQRGVGSTSPQSYYIDKTGASWATFFSQLSAIYITDASNYAWVILTDAYSTTAAYSLIFLGNIGGAGATSVSSSIVLWKGYLLVFYNGAGGDVDYASISTLEGTAPASVWNYAWETYSPSAYVKSIIGQEDDNVYFTTSNGLGSIIEQPNETFDPTDTNTYAFTDSAVLVPNNDRVTCVTELGSYLYLGGILSYVYVWDKVSPGFNQLLNLTEEFTKNIVATDQNVFIFCGKRGRVYISNGAAVDLYKKLPDYVSGSTNPFYAWGDASYSRGELYFSATAYNNASTQLTTTAGAWAINIETGALRLLNKPTNSGYGAIVDMVAPLPAGAQSATLVDTPGTGLLIGWRDGTTTYGIDRAQTAPYSNGESFIDTDMIPIGNYLSPFTGSQIEWKTSVPIGNNGTQESIAVYYRERLSDSFTLIDTSTSSNGTINGVTAISDLYQVNFQKMQWVQFRIVLTSNATTPTYCRLTELRIRDFPSN